MAEHEFTAPSRPSVNEALRALFVRPGMYVGEVDYIKVVAFLNGMSHGLWLLGRDEVLGPDDNSPTFYDWMCDRVGVASSPALGWHHLPLFLLGGLVPNEFGQPTLPPERDGEAIKMLGELLFQWRSETKSRQLRLT
ncbi:hypothetical protein [Microbacterium sp. Leaf320]|uniref:hypothetical protein n=1 Tax=Microbacterium sp. Leaf320 TaxID=1736334 RepID=UPI0006F24F4A|nr:hypothetical protein [Microbacterium sp. Leaf320]KQQ66937.1 hypothetical protein ASF63_06725 [Microbacterium sp. Leaf320]